MGDELVRLFLQLMDKVIDCNTLELQKLRIIDLLVKSNYFNELVYNNIDKPKNGLYDVELIESLIKICNYILILNPARLPELKKIIDRAELVIKLRVKKKDLIEDFEEKIDKVISDIENLERQRIINKTKKSKLFSFDPFDSETSDPPDLFYEVPIIPSLSEITENKRIYLRKNVTKGAYKNVQHYLDVNFRLLREDFLQPLREGINEFKAIIEEEKRTKTPNLKAIESANLKKRIASIDGLRAYYDVYFTSCSCTDKGITLSIQLDTQKFKGIKLEVSDRLKYGSLLCLSSDFFTENFILAVICDCDPNRLKKGIITVILENGINIEEELLVREQTKYLMFETTAYYEAYFHVLNSLKAFQDNNFPFVSQIVECNNLKRPPLYLMKANRIDMRTLINDDDDSFDCQTGNYDFDSSIYNYAKDCSIYDEKRWPSPRQMKLDELQYQAIRSALTQKICIIQGPPGTDQNLC